MTQITAINIETLILVAIWNHPFIFQGCFKVSDKNSLNKQLIFFRCLCNKYLQSDLVDGDFCPEDYQFTWLGNEACQFIPGSESEPADYALYLLKYALNTTLIQMITRSRQRFASMDDEAMTSIARRMESCLKQAHDHQDEDIGFAVSMDFYPAEETGQAAVCLLFKNAAGGGEDDYSIH